MREVIFDYLVIGLLGFVLLVGLVGFILSLRGLTSRGRSIKKMEAQFKAKRSRRLVKRRRIL